VIFANLASVSKTNFSFTPGFSLGPEVLLMTEPFQRFSRSYIIGSNVGTKRETVETVYGFSAAG